MSLSKIHPGLLRPMTVPPAPSQTQVLLNELGNLPKWQLALLIGLPSFVVLAGGFWFWRRRRAPVVTKKEDAKAGSSKANVTSKSNIANSNSVKGTTSNLNASATDSKAFIVDNTPEHIKLKDMGNQKFKNGEYSDSLEFYLKALEATPSFNTEIISALHQNRAAAFEKLGQFAEAIKSCNEALKIQPKYVKALSRRARAYKSTGFISEALDDITAACILEQFSVESNIHLADQLLKDIGLEATEKILNSRKPYTPSRHAVESFLRSFANDPLGAIWTDPAISAASSTTSSSMNGEEEENDNENEPESGYLTALKEFRKRNYTNIIKLCEEDVNDDTSRYHLDACNLSGTLKFLSGYRKETEETFSKIIDSPLASDDLKVTALVKLGCHCSLQDNDFRSYFSRAEAINSKNGDIYHHRGQVLLSKGMVEEAFAEIEKAAEYCPEFPLAVASRWFIKYRFAVLTENSRDMQEADREFAKLIRKFPNSPDVSNLYAQIQLEKKLYDEATMHFDRVLELDPENTSIVVHKAMVEYQKTQDIDKVIGILEESLKIDDRNEFVYETLGSLELQRGNLDKSLAALNKSLEYAKSKPEITMLSSLKAAAEVQVRVRDKLGIHIPPTMGMPNPSGFL